MAPTLVPYQTPLRTLLFLAVFLLIFKYSLLLFFSGVILLHQALLVLLA